jgi:hypothetical protein
MKGILIDGLIKFLTIAACLAQILFAIIFFAKGEIRFGIFCTLAAVMLVYYFIKFTKGNDS